MEDCRHDYLTRDFRIACSMDHSVILSLLCGQDVLSCFVYICCSLILFTLQLKSFCDDYSFLPCFEFKSCRAKVHQMRHFSLSGRILVNWYSIKKMFFKRLRSFPSFLKVQNYIFRLIFSKLKVTSASKFLNICKGF